MGYAVVQSLTSRRNYLDRTLNVIREESVGERHTFRCPVSPSLLQQPVAYIISLETNLVAKVRSRTPYVCPAYLQ